MIFCRPSGEAGSGPSSVSSSERTSRPNWPNQVSPKPKYSRCMIVDLAAPDDRRLVDRLEVVLAVIGLKRDVHRLGQVLECGMNPDLARFDLQTDIAQAAGPSRRDGPRLTRFGRDRHAQGDLARFTCHRRRAGPGRSPSLGSRRRRLRRLLLGLLGS